MPLCASVYMCLVVTCWERADLLALVCGVYLCVCHFPIGILGQLWYLLVSIIEFCTLTYFKQLNMGHDARKPVFGSLRTTKIVSEYDQEIPQSQTADNPVAPRGRAAQPSRDTRKTN